MGDRSPEDHDEGRRCSCRSWLEQELAHLRDQLATEIRTRRLRVGDELGAGVLIEASEHLAVVRVETADGRVAGEVAASVEDNDGYAAFSLSVDGNVVAVLSVLDAAGTDPAVTRLVFDRPDTSAPWTVIDVNGIRRER